MHAADLQILFGARLPRQLGRVRKQYHAYSAIHLAFSAKLNLTVGAELYALEGD